MRNNSWCQIVLDLLDLTFAELFKDFHDNHMDNGLLTGFTKKHFETQTPVDFIKFTR